LIFSSGVNKFNRNSVNCINSLFDFSLGEESHSLFGVGFDLNIDFNNGLFSLDFNNKSLESFNYAIGITLFGSFVGFLKVFLLIINRFNGFFEGFKILRNVSESLGKESFNFVVNFELNVLSSS
jgi:hypothetical protein